MLGAYVSTNTQTHWDMHFSLLEFAINNIPHWVTFLSPFKMNCGNNPTFPSMVQTNKKCPSTIEFFIDLQANLKIAQAKLKYVPDRANHYMDKKIL